MTFWFVVQTNPGNSDIKDLPPNYKKWLEEEVVYIISPVEKEVFLKLQSNHERELFVEAFWKQRDPAPDTEKNEYKEEHYRRIEYANQNFGRETPKPGWMTDRGRIYIILGPPDDVQAFETKIGIHPSEIWFYQGLEDKGLPPALQLIFFQKKGHGEYQLYSPFNHGPQALLTNFEGDPTDYVTAYEKIINIEPSLSDATLTLIPGEKPAPYGKPSLSSEHVLNKIPTVPLTHVTDIYAQKFLEYKDTVEVEYTTNYILNSSLVKTKKDLNGVNFIQYALEPESLSIENYQDKYYTILEIFGIVSDTQDRHIYQFEKSIPLEFTRDQINQIKNRPLNILDMFPIIPGRFKLSILMKNKTSKEFTSLERTVVIPGPENTLQMTSPMLAYGIKKAAQEDHLSRPFQINDYQLYLPLNRMFKQDDTLVLAFQIHGLNEREEKSYQLKYTFYKNKEKFIEFTKNVSEYPEKPAFIEKIPLNEFPPAHYMIRIRLLEGNTDIVSSNEIFDVTPSQDLPRPWFYTFRLSKAEDPEFSYALGLQYLNSGNFEKAIIQMEKTLEHKKDSREIKLNLIRTYKKAITELGASPELLNPLGEYLLQIDNKEEALSVWEKSLEINPDQPGLREKIREWKK